MAGALKCNLKMQLCGNLSVLECSDLLSCQVPFFFFFFLKSCREGYSYMNLNFNRRGKKVDMAPYLSICKKAVLQAAGTNYDLFFCLDKHNGPLR